MQQFNCRYRSSIYSTIELYSNRRVSADLTTGNRTVLTNPGAWPPEQPKENVTLHRTLTLKVYRREFEMFHQSFGLSTRSTSGSHPFTIVLRTKIQALGSSSSFRSPLLHTIL